MSLAKPSFQWLQAVFREEWKKQGLRTHAVCVALQQDERGAGKTQLSGLILTEYVPDGLQLVSLEKAKQNAGKQYQAEIGSQRIIAGWSRAELTAKDSSEIEDREDSRNEASEREEKINPFEHRSHRCGGRRAPLTHKPRVFEEFRKNPELQAPSG